MMMTGSQEIMICTIAAFCVATTVMTVAVLAAPWETLEWRLIAISTMALGINLLALWLAVTTI